MNSDKIINNTYNYLKIGKLKNALKELDKLDSNYQKEITLLNSRFNRAWRQQTMGTCAIDEFMIEENKITNSILELLDRIKQIPTKVQNSIESTSKIQVLIEGDYEQFDKKKKNQLKKLISVMLEMPEHQIKILQILPGSIKVIIELPSQKAKLFEYYFKEKKLYFDNNFNQYFKTINLSKIEDEAYDLKIINEPYIILNRENYTLITFKLNKLDTNISHNLKLTFNELKKNGIKNIILDLRKVEFVDSSVASVILSGNKLWKPENSFIISGPLYENVKNILSTPKLGEILIITSSLSEAVNYLSEESNNNNDKSDKDANAREDNYLPCKLYEGHEVNDKVNNYAVFKHENRYHYAVFYNDDGSVNLRTEFYETTRDRDIGISKILKYYNNLSLYEELTRGKYRLRILKDEDGNEIARSCLETIK